MEEQRKKREQEEKRQLVAAKQQQQRAVCAVGREKHSTLSVEQEEQIHVNTDSEIESDREEP